MKTDLHYLVNILWSEEDRCYIAEVPELEGCMTHGSTPEEALRSARDAIASWIKAAKQLKHPVPPPVAERKISGKFNVRLPKHLHRTLVLKAAQDGVSLNQLVTSVLSHGL